MISRLGGVVLAACAAMTCAGIHELISDIELPDLVGLFGLHFGGLVELISLIGPLDLVGLGVIFSGWAFNLEMENFNAVPLPRPRRR